jgi:GNAT superfamily N-acetyltransferase
MKSKVILNDDLYLAKGYLISTDKTSLHFDVIHNFLNKQSYWAKGITKEKLKIAIENSICFGVYYDHQQIGFARVITDQSTFAYLADVFIISSFRKQGLSKWLMQTILAFADFKNIRRWLLATADAHALYAKFGFESLKNPDRFMQIFTPYPVFEK